MSSSACRRRRVGAKTRLGPGTAGSPRAFRRELVDGTNTNEASRRENGPPDECVSGSRGSHAEGAACLGSHASKGGTLMARRRQSLKRKADGSLDLRTSKGREIAARMRKARAARGKSKGKGFFAWIFGG